MLWLVRKKLEPLLNTLDHSTNLGSNWQEKQQPTEFLPEAPRMWPVLLRRRTAHRNLRDRYGNSTNQKTENAKSSDIEKTHEKTEERSRWGRAGDGTPSMISTLDAPETISVLLLDDLGVEMPTRKHKDRHWNPAATQQRNSLSMTIERPRRDGGTSIISTRGGESETQRDRTLQWSFPASVPGCGPRFPCNSSSCIFHPVIWTPLPSFLSPPPSSSPHLNQKSTPPPKKKKHMNPQLCCFRSLCRASRASGLRRSAERPGQFPNQHNVLFWRSALIFFGVHKNSPIWRRSDGWPKRRRRRGLST